VVKPWKITRSEPVLDCRIFKIRKDITVNPRTGQAHEMFVMENPDWVNIIPLTPDEYVIMAEQWRHGTQSVHLETPGGLIDPKESAEACARRELLEETGYEAGDIRVLATVHPNPAFQNNLQYYVLATNCRRVGEPKPDHAEDIAVRLVPLADIPRMIKSGEITHGIVIGAFYFFDCYRRRPSGKVA
jgi:ADP-ribose pyrophosphatase